MAGTKIKPTRTAGQLLVETRFVAQLVHPLETRHENSRPDGKSSKNWPYSGVSSIELSMGRAASTSSRSPTNRGPAGEESGRDEARAPGVVSLWRALGAVGSSDQLRGWRSSSKRREGSQATDTVPRTNPLPRERFSSMAPGDSHEPLCDLGSLAAPIVH